MLCLAWRTALLFACVLPWHPIRAEEAASGSARTIALGSGIAETICQLGACASLIAVDQSTQGLPALAGLPQVGYFRALSLEPLLALSAQRVVASSLAGPPAVLEGLAQAGVDVRVVEEEPTADGLASKLVAIGEAVDRAEEGRALAEATLQRLAVLAAALARTERRVTAVYLLGVGSSGLMAAGTDTLADRLMHMAGLENAFGDAEGYKAVSPELLISLQPEFILIGERTLAALGGEAGLKQQPALAAALAPGGSQLLRHDEARLLGLGPHTAEELIRIALMSHPGIEAALLTGQAREARTP